MSYDYTWDKAFQLAEKGNRKLLDQHIKQIYKTILIPMIIKQSGSKEVAREVATSVIFKFWEKFYILKETLPKNVNGYIYVMAKNALLHFNKIKNKQRKQLTFLDQNQLKNILDQSQIRDPSDDTNKKLIHKALHIAFGLLGDRCRELLKMNIIDKKTIRAIAPIMNFPTENAATQKKVSCVKKLRKLIYEEIEKLQE